MFVFEDKGRNCGPYFYLAVLQMDRTKIDVMADTATAGELTDGISSLNSLILERSLGGRLFYALKGGSWRGAVFERIMAIN